MADVFISYSSKDERIANEMCTAFEKEGLSCWIAPRNIQVGKEYGGEIIKGIEGCKVFFLCLSKDANESQHVLREVERAVNRKLPIIVYQHEETVLCIAENVVAFFPYDGAESGMRAQDGDVYFNQEKLSDYTDEQLVNFWGSSDWETANIRSWLNSDAAIVEYVGAKPTEDAASLYENGYESEAGFLYAFSEDEKNQLVLTDIETSQDKVFLLSKEEVEKYLIDQNLVLSAVPTENAVLLEGTGIYQDYYAQGERATYWGLRTQGDNACSVLCVGMGLGKTENFHSEYACSSLMGVRPAIVLPLEYVQTLEMK